MDMHFEMVADMVTANPTKLITILMLPLQMKHYSLLRRLIQ